MKDQAISLLQIYKSCTDCRYHTTTSRVPWANISQNASFFSRTDSLTPVIHHTVWGLPPLGAPMTLRPQLSAASLEMCWTSTILVWCLWTSTGIQEQLCWRCLTDSCILHTFPVHPHYTFPTSVLRFPLPSELVISCLTCPSLNPSVQDIQPHIWWYNNEINHRLWPKVLWYQGHFWASCLSMVFVIDNPWQAQKSNSDPPFRFRPKGPASKTPLSKCLHHHRSVLQSHPIVPKRTHMQIKLHLVSPRRPSTLICGSVRTHRQQSEFSSP